MLAANTGGYHAYSLPRALAGIAAAGYRWVEIAAIPGVCEHLPLTGAPVAQVPRVLADAGLQVSSLSGHTDLTTDTGVAAGCAGVRLCAELGVPILVTAVGGALNEDEDENAFRERLPQLLTVAEEYSVTIAIEVHGTLTGTGERLATLLTSINHPLLRANYDTANADYFAGVPAVDDLPAVLPQVVHCHLKDKRGRGHVWDFPPLGQGDVDLPAVLAQFAASDYAGPFSVEVEFPPGQHVSAEDVDRAMADSWGHLSTIATVTDDGFLHALEMRVTP